MGLTSDEFVHVMGRHDRKDLVDVLGTLGGQIINTLRYGRYSKHGIGILFNIVAAEGDLKCFVQKH